MVVSNSYGNRVVVLRVLDDWVNGTYVLINYRVVNRWMLPLPKWMISKVEDGSEGEIYVFGVMNGLPVMTLNSVANSMVYKILKNRLLHEFCDLAKTTS
jgi:hypothetical protein